MRPPGAPVPKASARPRWRASPMRGNVSIVARLGAFSKTRGESTGSVGRALRLSQSGLEAANWPAGDYGSTML
jgi:hypothetical protein